MNKNFLTIIFSTFLILFITFSIWLAYKFNSILFISIIVVIAFILVFFILKYYLKIVEFKSNEKFNKQEQLSNKNIKADNIEEWTKKTNKEIAQLRANEIFRKEFVGNVAHELKTPIFNIQGFVSTLIDGAINDSNVNIKYLERTDKNVLRLITLVKDLDTISQLETGKITLDYSDFDIYELIMEVFEMVEIRAIEYGVNLKTKAKKGIKVHADKEKITEVIHNLVLNSIIYGTKNGITSVNIFEQKDKILIEVKDNGIGINSKHLNHIFERFYRVDKSRSRERGGSGLGLSIVKHIIDSHNQTIEVKSTMNSGTTFTFSLDKS